MIEEFIPTFAKTEVDRRLTSIDSISDHQMLITAAILNPGS
jgi:hypothetical protein